VLPNCSFPTDYFNKKKKFLSPSHRFTPLPFLLSFLLFLPANHRTSAQSSPLPFSHEPNKVANTNSQSYSNFSQNNKNKYLHLSFTHWFEIEGVVAEAHLAEEAGVALGDGGGLGHPERPARISVDV
jgi:hypothetical protein